MALLGATWHRRLMPDGGQFSRSWVRSIPRTHAQLGDRRCEPAARPCSPPFAIAAASLMTAPVTGIAPAPVARAASPYVDPHFREDVPFTGLVNPTSDRVRRRRPRVRRREAGHRQGVRLDQRLDPDARWSTSGRGHGLLGPRAAGDGARPGVPRPGPGGPTVPLPVLRLRRAAGPVGARVERRLPGRPDRPGLHLGRLRGDLEARALRGRHGDQRGRARVRGWSCSTTGAPSSRATAAAG